MRSSQKIIDTNTQVSVHGRADMHALLNPFVRKNSKDVVGGASNADDQFPILKQYHLKGFEYGNWMSYSDRYDNLIAAQRSLKHLAQIIGSQNIGVNGNIGIAFGARGNGGAASAHYEPAMNMINLTKTRGAGTLAHEYGHALDYNFGSFIDQNKQYAALSGGRSTAQTLEDNTGGQIRAMMNKLLDALIQTESHQTMRKKADEYWVRRTEIFARFFEQYVSYKMRKISTDRYLCRSWETYTGMLKVVYWTEAEIKGVLPVADKLVAEFGKFLNGRGKLTTTPYPTTKKLKPAKKSALKAAPKTTPKPVPKPTPTPQEVKKAATPKTAIQSRNERIRRRTEAAIANHKVEQARKAGNITIPIPTFSGSGATVESPHDYKGRPYFKEFAEKVKGLDKVATLKRGTAEAMRAKKQLQELQKEAKKRNQHDIAIQTGLDERAIATLYSFVGNDDIRPVLNGIFFDPAGYAVAADAHAIAVVRCKVPTAIARKIILPNGIEQQGKYPSWRTVIPKVPLAFTTTTAKSKDKLKKHSLSSIEQKEFQEGCWKYNIPMSENVKSMPLCYFKEQWLRVQYVLQAYRLFELNGGTVSIYEDTESQVVKGTILQGKSATVLVMPMLKISDNNPIFKDSNARTFMYNYISHLS